MAQKFSLRRRLRDRKDRLVQSARDVLSGYAVTKHRKRRRNPAAPSASIPAQIRRLPSGEIQLKLSLKGKGAKAQAQAIRKALGKRVKSAVITGKKIVRKVLSPKPARRRKR